MKSSARVVVIGGGVVGCSVLYHLTKHGWSDVMLIERDVLTSGSSWHAAGGFHTLNGDPNVAKLQSYTVNLYKEIQEISGQDIGIHITGGVMLADNEARMDFLKLAHAKSRYLGMETEIISAAEAKRRFPLMDDKHFVGALYDPLDGHLDPAGTTHAYAKAARINGATVVQNNRVTGMAQRPDGTWTVHTEQGEVHAEHVVNAGGLWGRECGRLVGLELPILAMEHMYLLTEEMPEVVAYNQEAGQELIHAIDFSAEIYTRQEAKGMLVGTYEKACVPWQPRETPWDFGHELLQPDIDRIMPSLELGFQHYPALENAGIKQIINGPFTFAPDGNPLIGPIRGLDNYWCAVGVMAGFSQGGGVGLALSNWIVEGDPGFDVWAMDIARFGDWATLSYTNDKVRENYSSRFSIRFPNEELPAGRPLRTTPIYDLLKSEGAVFGDAWSLEQALWYARDGKKAEDIVSFRRSNDFESVGKEVAAVRNNVGLLEISGFAKYEITGPGAEDWLNGILANRMPKKGRMVLAPMLNPNGNLIGDFTVARADDERFYIFGAGAGENYHMRWFLSHLPDSGASVRALGQDLTGLQIAGPKSRDLLARVAGRDVSAESFKFMAFDEFDIGPIPAKVGRVTFTGDLGYEIWVHPSYLRALWLLLREQGADLGLELFGGRALNSLRLEKNWGSWATEFRPIYTPWEAGMNRFVAIQKEAFIGRDAAIAARDAGPTQLLTTFVVDAVDADVISDEPIWKGEEVMGWVTSGGYAHHSQKSVAMGYVKAEHLDADADDYSIEIIGERRAARVQTDPLFDPTTEKMRS